MLRLEGEAWLTRRCSEGCSEGCNGCMVVMVGGCYSGFRGAVGYGEAEKVVRLLRWKA